MPHCAPGKATRGGRADRPESAPLLDNRTSRPRSQTFLDSLRHPPRQLTNLEKLLALGAVILLLLTSTFIGLFAGVESTLKRERKAGHGSGETITRTATVTELPTATTTVLGTTTVPAAPAPTGSPPAKLCTSRDCVLLSAGILASLNVTVDPCEDFYRFASESPFSSPSLHSFPTQSCLKGG